MSPTPRKKTEALGAPVALERSFDAPAAPTTSRPANTAPSTTTTPTSSPETSTPSPTPTAPPSKVATAFVANPGHCAAVRTRARSNRPLFDESSIFNTPAACLDVHPENEKWSSTWFNYANFAGRTQPDKRGEINIAFDAYSTPIFDAADATTWTKVYHPDWVWASNLPDGEPIPWNPAWRPAAGNDAEMVIIDYETGMEWALWGVMIDNPTGCWTGRNLLLGYLADPGICVWVTTKSYNTDGTIADGKSGDGYALSGDRGMGNLLARTLLPTLDEVERGSINHALNMETYATMFGPGCTAAQISAGVAGSDCGYAVSPATRLELPDGPLPCGTATQAATPLGRSQTLPEGMRFILNKSDAEIDAWLNRRGYVGKKRTTARIFAIAMRDFGWIISDSSCNNSSMAVEGVANPAARRRWSDLGITDPSGDGANLLEGLIESERDVVTLKPNTDKLFTSANW